MEKKKRFWTYENKMVIIFSFVFGFVLFDRFALSNLQNFVMSDMGWTYADFGLVSSVFGITWAVVGLFGSMIADTSKNRKRLMIIIVVGFSICSMLTGMVQGLIMMIIIRVIMGGFEGPCLMVLQGFVVPQSTPSRRGTNIGIIQVCAVGLITSLIGPLLQVWLAETIGWRNAFLLTIIPGAILAICIGKVLVNPGQKIPGLSDEEQPKHEVYVIKEGERGNIRDMLKAFQNRNCIVSLIATLFLLGWFVTTSTYLPGFLTQVKGLTDVQMSWVMSATGAGSICWGFVIPRISDKVGRKPLILVAGTLTVLGSLGWLYGPSSIPFLMMTSFIAWSGCICATMTQTVVLGDSVDPRYLSTLFATNNLTGELIGGMPTILILGRLVAVHGLTLAIQTTTVYEAIGVIIVMLFMKESAPAVLAKRKAKAEAKSGV